MQFSKIGAVALSAAVLAFASSAGAADAQAKRTASAAPASRAGGGAVSGICALSQQRVVEASTVGRFVESRMNQLAAQVQSELQGEQSALQAEEKALGTAPRSQSLQQREAAFGQKYQQRNAELQRTLAKANARIGAEVQPLVGPTFSRRGCVILLEANAVLVGPASMDITDDLIGQLNNKLTQFNFDREHLDASAAGQPAQ